MKEVHKAAVVSKTERQTRGWRGKLFIATPLKRQKLLWIFTFNTAVPCAKKAWAQKLKTRELTSWHNKKLVHSNCMTLMHVACCSLRGPRMRISLFMEFHGINWRRLEEGR